MDETLKRANSELDSNPDPVLQVPESPATKKPAYSTGKALKPTSSFFNKNNGAVSSKRSLISGNNDMAASHNDSNTSTSSSSEQYRPVPLLFSQDKPGSEAVRGQERQPVQRLMSLSERFSYNGGGSATTRAPASSLGPNGSPSVPAGSNRPPSIFDRYNALLSGQPGAGQTGIARQQQPAPAANIAREDLLIQRLQATHPAMPPHIIKMAANTHKSYEAASMWLYNSAPFLFGAPPPPPPQSIVPPQHQQQQQQQYIPQQAQNAYYPPPQQMNFNFYQGPPGQLNSKREVSRGMSIREKFSGYAGRRNLPNAFVNNDDYGHNYGKSQIPIMGSFTAKPRKRLVKARDDDNRYDYSDSDQEGEEYNAEEEYMFELRVLEFINTAKLEDIKDISACDDDLVQALVNGRPYTNLQQARAADIEQLPTKTKRRGNRKTAGEKVIDNCSQMLKGYEAIDSLIQRCDALGEEVSSGIKQWGINVLGTTEGDYELSITQIDGESQDNLDGATSAKESIKDETSEKAIVAGSGGEYFKEKPKLLADEFELKDYQQVGVNWMNLLYKKGLSCILADEMGLGKTFQVIAFLAHLKEKGIPGPHLVVVPASTLENWLREFKRFCPSLRIEPYYGSQSEREEIREALSDDNAVYDVIVTTYNLACGGKNDTGFLKSQKFNVIAYDEGHLLKNSQSERYTKLMKLKAKFRLLLTGTPLQNNLKELVSLLSFILPTLFEERREDLVAIFKHKAKASDNSEDTNNLLLSEQRIVKAKKMLFPFILRRKKEQVLKHLPKKTHKIEYCEMSEEQNAIYQKELESSKKLLELSRDRAAAKENSKPSSRDVSQSTSTVTSATASPGSSKEGTPGVEDVIKVKGANKTIGNILMQLRKAAIHPLLFRTLYDDDKLRVMAKEIMQEERYETANEDYIYEDMEVMNDFELNRLCEQFPDSIGKYALDQREFMKAGKVSHLAKVLPQMKADGDRILIFSQFTQMLDILERVLNNLDIAFLRLDGSTAVEIRQDMIDKFHNEEDITVFLLSTKAGGFGINLACANKVIIHDLSFNPHDDKQAEDRCHRVGQTRPVEVTRMITRNSIEENILALANTKLQLDRSLTADEGNDEKQLQENESLVAKMLLKRT